MSRDGIQNKETKIAKAMFDLKNEVYVLISIILFGVLTKKIKEFVLPTPLGHFAH